MWTFKKKKWGGAGQADDVMFVSSLPPIQHGFIGPDGDALRSTSFTDDTALFSTLSSLRRLVARVPHHLFVQSTLLAAIPLVWAMKGGSQVAVA